MIQDDKLPLKEKFLMYFRELPVQKLAAAKVGRNEDTIILWKKEDEDFSDQIEIAKADWALLKVKKIKSTEWLLERILKDHFAPRSPLLDEQGKPIPLLSGLTDVHSNNSPTKTEQTH